MTTVVQTFMRNLRGRQLYPFVIGFTSVLFTSAYLFRLKDEDYLSSSNKRFTKPFVKGATERIKAKGGEVPESASDH